jgi:hypothetical protein
LRAFQFAAVSSPGSTFQQIKVTAERIVHVLHGAQGAVEAVTNQNEID